MASRPWTINDAWRFGMKHGAILATCITLLWGGFTFTGKMEQAWNDHVAATLTRQQEVARIEKKVDKLQDNMDKILFLLQRRR